MLLFFLTWCLVLGTLEGLSNPSSTVLLLGPELQTPGGPGIPHRASLRIGPLAPLLSLNVCLSLSQQPLRVQEECLFILFKRSLDSKQLPDLKA